MCALEAIKGCNLFSRTIFCRDNLPVMRGINSCCIDLIYLDPPFNKGRNFHASVGTMAAGVSFHDIWSPDEVKDEWHNQINDRFPALYQYIYAVEKIGSRSAKYYLIYMAVRLLEMQRILKDTGSLYLHCDATASHYLKLLLDTIFGHKNFRNEIIWKRTHSAAKGSQYKSSSWGTNTDTILFYSKTDTYTLVPLRKMTMKELLEKFPKVDQDGRRYNTATPVFCSASMGSRPNLCYEWRGFKNPYPSGWRLSKERLEEEYEKGNVVIDGDRIERRAYEDEYKGVPIGNLWIEADLQLGSQNNERVGYPTQKPLELLKRIVEASSRKGDVVLDPFCGCATTCIAAEQLEREWIGIDVLRKAYDLVRERLDREVSHDLFRGSPIFRTDIPIRTDVNAKKSPTKKEKYLLYGMQDGRCRGCLTKFDIIHLEIDHIIPQSQGGGHELENIQLLCSYCNRKKGDRPMEYLMVRLKNDVNMRRSF